MTVPREKLPASTSNPLPWTFLAVALGVGTLLKVVAATSSLWLDELHSLGHGLQPDLAGVFEHTHFDFHAPLFFTAIHVVGSWQHPHFSKILTILVSGLTLIPLAAIARRLNGGRFCVVVACGLFSTMPYFTYYGQELRPYAFLMLATVTATWAAWCDDGPPWLRGTIFGIAVGVGLNSQYLMTIAVLGIGASRIFTAWPWRHVRDNPPLSMRALIGTGALGALLIVPWILGYMSWAIENPNDLVPTDVQTSGLAWREFLEAPLRMFAPRINTLGSWRVPLAIGAMAGTLGAVAFGSILWLRARSTSSERPFTSRVAAQAFVLLVILVPLTGFLSIRSWGRVGLQYYSIAAFAFPLVAAEVLASISNTKLRNTLAGFLLLCSLAGGVAQAFAVPREDMERGVDVVRQEIARVRTLGIGEPWISAVMRQPNIFEHRLAYSAYGADLNAVEPRELPVRGDPGFERPVILLVRRWDDFMNATTERQEAVRRLHDGRVVERQIKIDDAISVFVLIPPR